MKKAIAQAEFMFPKTLFPGCMVGRRGGRFVRTSDFHRSIGIYQEADHIIIYTVDGRKEFDLPAGVYVYSPVTMPYCEKTGKDVHMVRDDIVRIEPKTKKREKKS